MHLNKKKIKFLFFIAVSVLFWLSVILFLGVYSSIDIPRNGVLPNTFNWWNHNTVSIHLFLGMYEPNHIDKGLVYTTYTIPFNLIMYSFVGFTSFLSNRSFEISQNVLPFINVFAFVFFLLRWNFEKFKSYFEKTNLFDSILSFLLIGLIVTNALPWVSLLRYNAENPHMFASVIFCYLSLSIYNPITEKTKDKRFLTGGVLLSILNPYYIIAWCLCYLIQEENFKIRRVFFKNVLWVTLSFVFNYFLPISFAKLNGFGSSASGFLFRSGLDGNDTYFKSNLGAIFNPISEQHLVNDIILLLFVIVIGYLIKDRKRYLKQFSFLMIPMLTIFILFPQFTSIHMYMVEFLFVIPCIYMIFTHFFEIKSIFTKNTTAFVYTCVLFSFLIFGQLIDIARAFQWFKFNL